MRRLIRWWIMRKWRKGVSPVSRELMLSTLNKLRDTGELAVIMAVMEATRREKLDEVDPVGAGRGRGGMQDREIVFWLGAAYGIRDCGARMLELAGMKERERKAFVEGKDEDG